MHSFLNRGLAGLFLLSVPALHALAETVTTGPVVVTASRTAQTADATLASVTVITREEIANSQARDVADVLRLHGGVELGRNGGPGQFTSIFLRGTESNHVLVLIDGVRINPGTIGAPPFQNINPDQVERIEIVRGPRSSLYGSDAVGGVIQIFTRRTEQDLATRGNLMAGSNNTRALNAGIQGNRGRLRAGLDAGRLETDGFPTRTTSTLDQGHDNLTANAYLGYGGDALDVEISHWHSEGNTEYLDFFLAPLDQDFENAVTTLTARGNRRGTWVPTLKVSRTTDDIRQQQGADFARTRRWILDWQNDVAINDNNLLTAGVYLVREDTDARSFGTAFDEHTDVNAVFIQNHWTRAAHQLLASARHTDHEGFGGHTTGNLAYGYRFSTATRAFASIGSAFRAPDASDRFGFGGNPDLEPETSRNLEVGISHALDAHQTLQLTVFQNQIDDLIIFHDPDGFLGPAPGGNENVQEARIRGVELSYVINHAAFSGRIEASLQAPENLDTGKDLARRARRSLSASSHYDFGRFTLGSELLLSSSRRDSDFSQTRLPGYGILNLNITMPLSRRMELLGKIENVLDHEYVLAEGFRTQDRAAWLTLRYRP